MLPIMAMDLTFSIMVSLNFQLLCMGSGETSITKKSVGRTLKDGKLGSSLQIYAPLVTHETIAICIFKCSSSVGT